MLLRVLFICIFGFDLYGELNAEGPMNVIHMHLILPSDGFPCNRVSSKSTETSKKFLLNKR
jgi:hypothetical protein